MASTSSRAVKTFKQVRQTIPEPDNKALRLVVKELEESFTKLLCVALPAGESIPADRTFPSLTLKCAHDPFIDVSTGNVITPHFIADCTQLCKQLADVIAKRKFNDTQQLMYGVIAISARKAFLKTKKTIVKTVKAAAKAERKADAAAAKAAKSDAKSNERAQQASDKAVKLFEKAQKAVEEAKQKAVKANEIANEADEKAATALRFHENIIQCWHAAVATAKTQELSATDTDMIDCPSSIECCQLYLAPSTKRNGADGQRRCRVCTTLNL